MSFKYLLPLALFAASFQSCSSQKMIENKNTLAGQESFVMPKTASPTINSTYPAFKQDENTVRLPEGKNIFIKDKQFNISFNKVVSDNRCPMNARCIWAGDATVEIELMSTTSRPKKFKLSTGDLRDKSKTRFAYFDGYKFTLENLYPSTTNDMNFEKLKGYYVIDVKVENITMDRRLTPTTK